MRIIVLSLILFCCGTCPITAQSDYIVTTPSTQEIPVDEQEQFIKKKTRLGRRRTSAVGRVPTDYNYLNFYDYVTD